jgi:hypothetical protein
MRAAGGNRRARILAPLHPPGARAGGRVAPAPALRFAALASHRELGRRVAFLGARRAPRRCCLGLLHVLLARATGRRVGPRRASGFAPWADRGGTRQPGLRAQVMSEFTPDKVESWTGVAAARIADLAREMVAAGRRWSWSTRDVRPRNRLRALLVNALLGSIDVPGGMQLPPGRSAGRFRRGRSRRRRPDRPARAAIDGRGTRAGPARFQASRILALPEAFLSGKPYATKVLLLSYFQSRLFEARRQALARGHGQGSLRRLLFALPRRIGALRRPASARSHLLRALGCGRAWAAAPGALSLRQPVVRPLADTLQTGEVILRLARASGRALAELSRGPTTGKPCWRGLEKRTVAPTP